MADFTKNTAFQDTEGTSEPTTTDRSVEYADAADITPIDQIPVPGDGMGNAKTNESTDQSTEVDLAGSGTDDSTDSSGEPGGQEQESQAQWSREILSAAGITKEQAQSLYGTPENLVQAIREHDQRMINSGIGEQGRQEIPDSTPGSQESESPIDEFQMPQLGDDGDWDEPTRQLVNSLNDYHSKQLKAELAKRDAQLAKQQEALDQFQKGTNQAALDRYVDEFDAFIAELPPQWEGVFGKGSGRNMDQGTMAFQNRLQFDAAANALEETLKQSGVANMPTKNEIRIRALRATFADQAQQQDASDVNQALEKRRQMITRRPGAGSAPTANQKGDAAAIANVQRFFADRGIPSTDFGTDEFAEGI